MSFPSKGCIVIRIQIFGLRTGSPDAEKDKSILLLPILAVLSCGIAFLPDP